MHGRKNDLLTNEFYKKEKKKTKKPTKGKHPSTHSFQAIQCVFYISRICCEVSTFFQNVSLIELNAQEEK